MNVLELVSKYRVVPVVEIGDAQDAKPLGEALMEGGLPLAEVTFRTSCAAEAIAILAKEFPSMLVGAGTVLSVDQVKLAMDSGAKFIVSPGLSRTVVEYCLKNSIAIFPGVVTPTELQEAIELGLEVVKFFPAETSGGVKYLKSISGPFNTLKFMPTGGINGNNIMDYLSLGNVVACGGSSIAPKKLIGEKNFSEITRLTKEMVAKIG